MNFKINTKLIIDYMKRKNLGEEEFCKLCEIKPCHFKRIISKASNVGRVPVTVFVKIAKVLGVKFSDIISVC